MLITHLSEYFHLPPSAFNLLSRTSYIYPHWRYTTSHHRTHGREHWVEQCSHSFKCYRSNQSNQSYLCNQSDQCNQYNQPVDNDQLQYIKITRGVSQTSIPCSSSLAFLKSSILNFVVQKIILCLCQNIFVYLKFYIY